MYETIVGLLSPTNKLVSAVSVTSTTTNHGTLHTVYCINKYTNCLLGHFPLETEEQGFPRCTGIHKAKRVVSSR